MRTEEEYREIVERPGKFEGCSPWVPYYWDFVMDGGEDQIGYDGDIPTSYFRVSVEDREMWPELCATEWVAVEEDEQGFVYGWFCDCPYGDAERDEDQWKTVEKQKTPDCVKS